MAVEKRSLNDALKNILVIMWLVLSTGIYGMLCVFIGPFSKWARRFIGVIWNSHLLYFAGVKVLVTGVEKLDKEKRYVFIANHQSHIDIPVLYNALPFHISFIAKKELFRIPVFGWALYVAGHIWIDRGNARKAHASIKRAIEKLRNENISLVIFPEGTRSRNGAIGTFKQGSFTLVKQAGVEAVPVAIHDTLSILSKHSKKITSGTVHVTVCDPIAVESTMTKTELATSIHDKLAAILASSRPK